MIQYRRFKFAKSEINGGSELKEDAFDLNFKIKFKTISDIRKQDYLQLSGKCFEKLGKFKEAYDCFAQSNLLIKKTKEYLTFNSENYFQNSKDNLIKLKSKRYKTPLALSVENSDFTPTFLVGFPRSGTTLLDTILRSNSKISIVEEQPMLAAAENFLNQNSYYDFAGQIIPKSINIEARKIYIEEFKKHIKKVNRDAVYIDKLPLHLFKAPLINQLYYDAKFILVLRHPMDSILSCWMQNFKLNAAMVNMVDLDRIVDFYCIAMETFKICKKIII